jgi:hypothetical protein
MSVSNKRSRFVVHVLAVAGVLAIVVAGTAFAVRVGQLPVTEEQILTDDPMSLPPAALAADPPAADHSVVNRSSPDPTDDTTGMSVAAYGS